MGSLVFLLLPACIYNGTSTVVVTRALVVFAIEGLEKVSFCKGVWVGASDLPANYNSAYTLQSIVALNQSIRSAVFLLTWL